MHLRLTTMAAAVLVAATAHANLCMIPVPCGTPDPAACYELKVPGVLITPPPLTVPLFDVTVEGPEFVTARRICTPACVPGARQCPDFNGDHLLAQEGWNLPGLGDREVEVNVGDGPTTLRLSRGGFVLSTASKRVDGSDAPIVPLARVFACWAASGADKRRIPYTDQFGAGIARTHQVAQVCVGATLGGVATTGGLVCYRTRRNTLPDDYRPRQPVSIWSPLQGPIDTQLEGLDEFCLPATVALAIAP